VLLIGGQHDEREGPVTTTLVLWDTATRTRDEHLLATRPGLSDEEPSEEAKKNELAKRKAAVAELTQKLAATTWLPLSAGAATFDGVELIVRVDDQEILREPHPEWILPDEPPCSEDPADFAMACGCSFPVLVNEALVDAERRVALLEVDRPIDHHCESAHPGAFWHLARAAVKDAAPDAATTRWTLADSVSLLCRAPADLNEAMRDARRALVRGAITEPAGRAAVWSAMATCGEPASIGDARSIWEEAFNMDKHGVGIAEDGTVVLGTVDCDRLSTWNESLLHGPAAHDAKRKRVSRDKAEALAPPRAMVAGWQLVLDSGTVGEEPAVRYDLEGVSLLGVSTCDLPPGKKVDPDEEPSALDQQCTTSVYARARGDDGPGALVHRLTEEFFWAPRSVVAWARPGVPSIVVGLVKGGDHGCGTFDLVSWAGPGDLASAINTSAVGALKSGDRDDAQVQLAAALALDPKSELARYNLACALALDGDAAGAATTLAPLLAGEAKDRARWVTRIGKDKDFDAVRTSAELSALLGASPP